MSNARKSGTSDVLKYVKRLRSQIEYAKKQFDKTRDVVRRLTEDPDDPSANLIVGKFLCYAKGDFDEGLPQLVKGSDERLKQLAATELAHPQDAQAQVQLADSWWELANEQRDHAEEMILQHALKWYARAYPGLKGIIKTRVESRMRQ